MRSALSSRTSAILVLALPGDGKTSLITHLMETINEENGRELLNDCVKEILKLNKDQGIEPYEIPEQPPIYADNITYKVKFKVGYKKWFEPYALNPYYMGMTNEKIDTQYILPYGVVFIPEIHRYADSRESFSFPPQIAKMFQIRRHFHLKFIMDGHRGTFIDKKIREMCDCVIDLLKQEHDYDGLNRIIRTRWYCREFTSYEAYEEYCAKKSTECRETVYEHEFEIFDDYDSYGCKQEFLPPKGKGVQFSTLKPLSMQEVKKLPKEIAKYYDMNEPKGFRKK